MAVALGHWCRSPSLPIWHEPVEMAEPELDFESIIPHMSAYVKKKKLRGEKWLSLRRGAARGMNKGFYF